MSVRTLVKSIQNIMRQDTGVDGDAQRISQLCWMFFLKIIDDQDQELELMRPGYASPIPKRYQWRAWAADPEGITGEELLAFVDDDLFPSLKAFQVTGRSGDRRRVIRAVFEDAYNYMKSGQLMRQVVNKINEVDFNNLSERQHFGDIYEQILNDLQSAGCSALITPTSVWPGWEPDFPSATPFSRCAPGGRNQHRGGHSQPGRGSNGSELPVDARGHRAGRGGDPSYGQRAGGPVHRRDVYPHRYVRFRGVGALHGAFRGGEGLFTAGVLEMDPGTRTFVAVPVFSVPEMPSRE